MPKRESPMWFRLPIDAGPPPLVSDAAGIERVVSHPSGSYAMTVNILDSEEGRLLRAGVTVAHRSRDGEGEWYISSPHWPGLPDEVAYELDDSGNLPSDVRRRLNLFLRRAPLEPFATMELERRAFTLRGSGGDIVRVLDDVVTIVRDGQVRSTSREITMEPCVKLDGQQREFIHSAMAAIDAVPLDRPPTLPERIGPPATGLTSFRAPTGIAPDMTLEEFVSEVFLTHLHRLLLGELRDDPVVTRDELASIFRDLRGLSSVLEPSWREELEHNLRMLPCASDEDREPILLHVIDALVSAVRAPKLGNHSSDGARAVLFARADQSVLILFDRCRALDRTSTDEAWGAALRSAEQLDAAAAVMEPLFRKPLRRARQELETVLDSLRMSVRPPADIEVVGLTPEEAFQLGRDVEHAQWSVDRARRQFIAGWPERVLRVRKELKKMRKKLR
jgi:hypothetical protein